MKSPEFFEMLGRISVVHGQQGEEFAEVVKSMVSLLDEADYEDVYDTEGWRHNLGWDE